MRNPAPAQTYLPPPPAEEPEVRLPPPQTYLPPPPAEEPEVRVPPPQTYLPPPVEEPQVRAPTTTERLSGILETVLANEK